MGEEFNKYQKFNITTCHNIARPTTFYYYMNIKDISKIFSIQIIKQIIRCLLLKSTLNFFISPCIYIIVN